MKEYGIDLNHLKANKEKAEAVCIRIKKNNFFNSSYILKYVTYVT